MRSQPQASSAAIAASSARPAILPGAEPYHCGGSQDRAEVGVLCVHGLTSTPQMIRPVAEHLAGLGYAVSAPLLPGHGTTWRELSRFRYRDWIREVERAAIDLHQGRRSVIAVGVSLGGALVSDLAYGRPDLVDALALINPAFTADSPLLPGLPVLSRVLRSIPGIGDDIRRPGPPRELVYPRTPLRALHSFVEQWPRLVRQLPEIEQPLLLLRSRHDKVVPARSGDIVLGEIGSRDVESVWLEDSGHVATLDYDADLLLAAVTRFVERNSAPIPDPEVQVT